MSSRAAQTEFSQLSVRFQYNSVTELYVQRFSCTGAGFTGLVRVSPYISRACTAGAAAAPLHPDGAVDDGAAHAQVSDGPGQCIPAGDGRIGMVLGPVSRGRAGGGDEGGVRSGGLRTILLVRFSFTLLVPTARSAPPPRAAGRSIRLLCVLTAYLPTCAGSCVVAAVRRWKGADGGGERGRAGRLFEATEIATTDDRMLMDKALNSIVWTSAGARQTDHLLNFLAVCDST